jgi:hypothetical protein
MSVVLLAHGQPAAALSELERLESALTTAPSDVAVYFPAVLEALGRTAEAERARAEAEAKFGKTDPFQVGFMYAAHHDTDRALLWWERALLQHDIRLGRIKSAPAMALNPQLASDPRYKTLLRKMNLPET